MGPVLPVGVGDIYQAQLYLIDEGRRLQGVPGRFIFHVPARQPAEFRVHLGYQAVQGRRVPVAPSPKQPGEFRASKRLHHKQKKISSQL